MKELRRGLIENKLTKIIDSVNIIAENLPPDFDGFKRAGLVKDGIYKKIEFVIEGILDVCNIINSDLKLGMPEDEDNILDNLEIRNIFDKRVISLIREMKRFRNILVHRYGDINDEQAFETIRDSLKDIDLIIKKIEVFLRLREKKLN